MWGENGLGRVDLSYNAKCNMACIFLEANHTIHKCMSSTQFIVVLHTAAFHDAPFQ
jgi:hypothetical protein